MPRQYFFLYLVYGFAFINMGMFALQKKDVEVSSFPLVGSMKYLGWFGVSHGVSEWVTMVVIADLYPEAYLQIFVLKQMLKAISFTFLLRFGLSLLSYRNGYPSWLDKLPLTVFIFWLSGFIAPMFRFGIEYHLYNPVYNSVVLRYFMGLSGGLISAVALNLQATIISKRRLKVIAQEYRALAVTFLLYSILDGMIVRKMGFFPANIINDELFLVIMRFPIQIAKTLTGVGINVLLVRVIKTFGWEQKEKLMRLQQNRIRSEERRKLGMEVHDSIIQDLYAAGLKTEYTLKNSECPTKETILREIKSDLNHAIGKTREFMVASTFEVIEFDDLIASIEQLVHRYSREAKTKISLKLSLPILTTSWLSQNVSTQIYYITQEAISNVIKHANATEAEVWLGSKQDVVILKIIDNGKGMPDNQFLRNEHFGMMSMKQRAESIGGVLKVKSTERGTTVEVQIPWEALDYAGN